MDIKTKGEKTAIAVKRFFGAYFGLYAESFPKTFSEIKENVPKIALTGGKYLIVVLLSMLFGRKNAMFSANPYGIAIMCSLSKTCSWSYLGVLFSCLGDGLGLAVPKALIYSALYVGRIIVCKMSADDKPYTPFNERLKIRMIEGVCTSVLLSTYKTAVGGFLYYDIFGGFFEILTVPLLIFCFDGVFSKDYIGKTKREIGFLSLGGVIASSLADISLFGFSLGSIFALMSVLFVSKITGSSKAALYGLICGLAVSPELSSVYCVLGCCTGVMWGVNEIFALCTGCIICAGTGIYVGGFESVRTIFPDVLVSSALFFPAAQTKIIGKIGKKFMLINADDEKNTKEKVNEIKHKDMLERFEALSQAFSALSEVFYSLSNKKTRQEIINSSSICDKVCDKFCPGCSNYSLCWEGEYSATAEVFGKIKAELREKGHSEGKTVPNYFKLRCVNIGRIVNMINDLHAKEIQSAITENKTEIFAMDYESISHLLMSAVNMESEEYYPDNKTASRLRDAAGYLGITPAAVCVFGKRKITAVMTDIDMQKITSTPEEIRGIFQNVCKRKLTTPMFDMTGECVNMTLCSEKIYSVEYAAAMGCKKNEDLCGDFICMFETKQDRFYALISDGMGSGREAAFTSRLCGVFLKKMLLAGNSKPVSLEMLNNFIRSKNTECFATLDLLEIDLLNGQSVFVKGGAVASYIKRKDRIFRIASNTLPIGITKEMNAEEIKTELCDGDLVVMVSDGIGEPGDDTVFMGNVLTYCDTSDLQKLADGILIEAQKICGRSDDISVGVIRIVKSCEQ